MPAAPPISPAAAAHDAYAADYDSQVKAYGAHIADVLFGLCYEYLLPGQRLLDLGIGSGLSAALFAKAGLLIHGVDFSPAMLELCRLKGIAVELKLHDLSRSPWPYAEDEFDHLVCCGVLHFLPDLEAVFAEARRVLKAGGVFAFTTKAPASPGGGDPYERALAGGMEIYSHHNTYLESVLELVSLVPLKGLKSNVGEDAFYAWIAQNAKG